MKYINSVLGLPDIRFSSPIISDKQILIPDNYRKIMLNVRIVKRKTLARIISMSEK